MTLHYRISDPSDVRDLGDLFATWVETGNPKADDWAEQPPAPSTDALWLDGAWVIPPPPEPEPNWGSFKRLALTHPGLNAAVLAADPIVPLAARSLSSSLAKAETGSIGDFAGCWRAVVAAANPAPEVIEELLTKAAECNLPVEFINSLNVTST